MKTASKNMTWKVAAMVVALSLVSAPVFAASLSPAISAPLATKTILWPSYLVLYNDSGEDVYDVQVMKLLYMDVNGFFHWEKIADVAFIALHTQAVVRVPGNVGLGVLYCAGRDGCNPYASDPDAKTTGSFGPVKSGYYYLTLH
jgi:hypothetical protein